MALGVLAAGLVGCETMQPMADVEAVERDAPVTGVPDAGDAPYVRSAERYQSRYGRGYGGYGGYGAYRPWGW